LDPCVPPCPSRSPICSSSANRRRSDTDRIQLLDRLGSVFYNAAHLTGDTKPDEVEVAACRLSEVSPPDMIRCMKRSWSRCVLAGTAGI
jgi:hypothetical protein